MDNVNFFTQIMLKASDICSELSALRPPSDGREVTAASGGLRVILLQAAKHFPTLYTLDNYRWSQCSLTQVSKTTITAD